MQAGVKIGSFMLVMTACSAAEEDPPPAAGVTYHGEIRALYEERCVSCHSEGGLAPFALDSYEMAKATGLSAKLATAARIMPPWGIDGSGECGTYRDSRELTDEQMALIARWVDEGAPEGDPASARTEPPTQQALTGLVVSARMTEPYTPVPDRIGDDNRCFLLDETVERDAFVTGFEVVPGNPAVVHHILVFAVDPIANRDAIASLDSETAAPGWPCFGSAGDGINPAGLAAIWTPGVEISRYPEGTGLEVRAGQAFIMQVHYYAPEPSGPDQTELRLQIEDTVEKRGSILLLDGLIATAFSGSPFVIPPRQERVLFTWDTRMEDGGMGPPDMGPPDDMGPPGGGGFDSPIDPSLPYEVHGVFPHMHQLGRKMRANLVGPDLEPSCAAKTDRYDFHWQEMFFFEDPITVSPGQGFEVTCEFDSRSRMMPTMPGFGAEEEMCSFILFATQ